MHSGGKVDGIEKRIVINAPRAAVFSALTSLPEIGSWWQNPVSGSADEGADIRFGLQGTDEFTIMHVDVAEEPSKVQWSVTEDTGFEGEWVGTKIVFRLSESEQQGTDLLFQHIGLTPDLQSYEPCRAGWDHFLGNLARHCEEVSAGGV